MIRGLSYDDRRLRDLPGEPLLALTQAEAVIDLIHAETTRDAKNAASQLGGAVLRHGTHL